VWLLNGQFDRFRMQERAFLAAAADLIVSCARAGCGLPPGSAARSTLHACCSVFSTGADTVPRHCWIADALVSFMVGLRETFGN
jgi:hypothetical protein